MLRVEMLSTGDEVLHGHILDTNAAWLAGWLFSQGAPMRGRATVGDDITSLVEAIDTASRRADVLIVNGGLGPTADDLSAQAAAQALGVALVENRQWLARMSDWFAARGRDMLPCNRKQALLPAGAAILDNPCGTACGFVVELNRCLIFFTPGVPDEFKTMVEREILPRLRQCFVLPEPPLCLRLTTFGRAESELAGRLDPLRLPPEVTLGYRSSMPVIELKLTGPARQREVMLALWAEVKKVAGDSLIYEGDGSFPAHIAWRLRERQLSLTLSEQFTGGLLALRLLRENAPLLASETLPGRQETLVQTARAGAQRRVQQAADLALAISGLTDGALNFALATPGATYALSVSFSTRRYSQRISQQIGVVMALNMLRRWLNGQNVAAGHGWIKVVESLTLE